MKKASLIIQISLLLAPLAALHAADPATPAKTTKPNIIFILADDLGIGNVSCYGADNFKTPNVDKLAQSGLRFEQCHASQVCGPTRAQLMTGRYAFRTGMTANSEGKLLKPDKEIMMPRVLKPAGYVTAQCGKWDQLPLQPGDWGFDEYLRFKDSGIYWNTQKKGDTYTLNGQEVPLHDGEYMPDRMHNFVVDFIERHKEQPFYIYYSMSHVHADILPTPDTVPGTTNTFIWYQDNVTYMDKLVGKLVAELDRLKLRENTLIVFAGDNGTASPWYKRSTVHGKPLSGHKLTMLENGALVPCFANWPGKIAANQVTKSLVNICDFFPTFAEVAGAKLPAGVTLDGRNITPQILGQSKAWPRDWIFVQWRNDWFDRDAGWKLNRKGELFDMSGAPFAEPLVPADTKNETAIAARKRLQAALDQLNPADGIAFKGEGQVEKAAPKGKEKKPKKGSSNEEATPGNANAADQ
ncbi:MAG: sulfatase-like hydrolase/transferase [Verrucomicrobiota bacterium]